MRVEFGSAKISVDELMNLEEGDRIVDVEIGNEIKAKLHEHTIAFLHIMWPEFYAH